LMLPVNQPKRRGMSRVLSATHCNKNIGNSMMIAKRSELLLRH
jgi:hypothetical protein